MIDHSVQKTARFFSGVSPRNAAPAVLLCIAWFFCCYPALSALVAAWTHQDLYAYGYLIPVITVIWIWHERGKFRFLPAEPSLLSGSLILIPIVLLLAGGSRSSTASAQQLALVCLAPALVLLVLGRRFLKALGAHFAYLVLMVPVLDVVVEALHPPFQIFAAWTAEQVLQAANVPVLRTGRFLELPSVTLEVADVCSGVRFLVSTLVLSIPLVFITQKRGPRRVVLFLCALIISVTANPIRVALIGFWAYYGSGDVHGPGHLLQGYVVYLAGMLLLFAAAWVLQRSPEASEASSVSAGSIPRADIDFKKFRSAFFISFAVFVAAGYWQYTYEPEPVSLKKNLDNLPLTIGDWEAQTGIAGKELFLSGADERFNKVYRNKAGSEIEVTISYLEYQKEGKKLVSNTFRPPGDDGREIEAGNSTGNVAEIPKTTIRAEDRTPAMRSWYKINGRITASRYKAKLLVFLDGLLYGKTNGALITISGTADQGAPEHASRNIRLFAQQFLPVLEDYIP